MALRTGMQWGALKATGLCHPSSAYRRFREWLVAGVFREFWRQGLLAYDGLAKIDWRWLARDGTQGDATLGGGKTGPNPTNSAKRGTKRSRLTDSRGGPLGLVVAGANTNDFKLARSTLESIPVRRPLPTRSRRQTLCVDIGYAFRPVRELTKEYGFTLRAPKRRSHLSPKRMRLRRPCHDVSSSEPTHGSTASDVCWCAGKSERAPTWRCLTSRWASSLGSTRSCRNRLGAEVAQAERKSRSVMQAWRRIPFAACTASAPFVANDSIEDAFARFAGHIKSGWTARKGVHGARCQRRCRPRRESVAEEQSAVAARVIRTIGSAS